MPLQNRGLFTYPDDMYNPESLEFLNRSSLQKEYNRLRKEANRRLAQFDGTEWTTSDVYMTNAGRYDQNINKMTVSELRYALTDVHDYLRLKTSTVRGLQVQRAKAIKTLNARGFTSINKKNFRKFAEYMKNARQEKLDALYGSEILLEYYETVNTLKKTPDEILDDFMKEQEQKELRSIKKYESIHFKPNKQSHRDTGKQKNNNGQKGKQGRRKKGKNS